MPDLTPDEVCELLQAGARHNGTYTNYAAIHLLTYTELVQHREFQKLIEVDTVNAVRVAFVRDWAALPDTKTAIYLGGGDARLLRLAVALATQEPVNLAENLMSFGHAHAKRAAEAILIATGYREWYTVEPTATLADHLARQAAMFGGPDA